MTGKLMSQRLLALFAAAAMLALSMPLRLPLGAFYWDAAVYLDAFQRIHIGQMPAVDFFAPVGPAGYYLGAWLHSAFPQAQPMLLVNWAILPLVLPLALAVLLQRDMKGLALALIVPFLVFAALPINLAIFYPAPGLDGFGTYNRHAALLLYWLVAALLFWPPSRTKTALVAACMLALVLTKVTGAVAGAILVGYAWLAGRLRFADAVFAALACLLALALIDLATGLIRAYLADILTRESIEFETGALGQIALAARGSMRDALSLLDQAIAFGGGKVNEAGASRGLASRGGGAWSRGRPAGWRSRSSRWPCSKPRTPGRWNSSRSGRCSCSCCGRSARGPAGRGLRSWS